MSTNSKQQKRRDNALSLLDVAIEATNLAKEASSGTPAQAVFGPVNIILTMIKVRVLSFPVLHPRFTYTQDSMANKADYVDLGLACADVCKALDRGMNGKKLDDLSQPVREAINQLTMWVRWVIHSSYSSLTVLLMVEPWRRSKGRSPNRAGEAQSLDLSMRRLIGEQSPLGSRTSTGSFTSSMCAQTLLPGSYSLFLFRPSWP